jgi:hypothetical protein
VDTASSEDARALCQRNAQQSAPFVSKNKCLRLAGRENRDVECGSLQPLFWLPAVP